MKPLQLAFNSTFPQILPWPIAILNLRASDLAERLTFRLDQWEEDGLGPTCGFATILGTGLWVLVEEREHTIDRGLCNGPTISVLALQTENVDDLLAEVLNAFGLTNDDVQTKRIRNSDNWT